MTSIIRVMATDNYYVYIMANKSRTTLYIGMTNGLTKRVLQHRHGDAPGFTQRYNCNRLIYFEAFAKPSEAIAREKQLKRWRRTKKEQMIQALNPELQDLAVTVLGLPPPTATPWKDDLNT